VVIFDAKYPRVDELGDWIEDADVETVLNKCPLPFRRGVGTTRRTLVQMDAARGRKAGKRMVVSVGCEVIEDIEGARVEGANDQRSTSVSDSIWVEAFRSNASRRRVVMVAAGVAAYQATLNAHVCTRCRS
jgi:hypothetical protein